ncbi:MAG: ATP-binding protein [Pseudolysinimonas sp.]|uniref:ATP-binding protein n=1 Tax=Pseudolysinimonas sp. TaxID=2680009 RepID=UPI003C719D2B
MPTQKEIEPDTETFTVDAKLLQELGERLVGRPDIALAELIKNSFDADARDVVIAFDGDRIIVSDNGHGMSKADFIKRWMRIGTPEKADDHVSPNLHRSLTGSKGVGRLAAQLLARDLRLTSRALVDAASGPTDKGLRQAIEARIHWPNALKEKDLTDVKVELRIGQGEPKFPDGSLHGTTIVMSGLVADWGPNEFEGLARQIWALKPPFEVEKDDAHRFNVELITPRADIQQTFDRQMTALLDNANAIVRGRLLATDEAVPALAERFELTKPKAAEDEAGEIPADDAVEADSDDSPAISEALPTGPRRSALISVEVGIERQHFVVDIPSCQIDGFDFEIRIFDLVNRQPQGILVKVAREYLSDFGGVHIYDNGFRLPYYGPDTDWLRLELDHARRLSRSRLLPDFLQVRNAMQDLPSNKRVFGAVNISTSHEQRQARLNDRKPSDALAIQITRDRLAESVAFDQLTRTVRLGIDLYALARSRSRALRALNRPKNPRVATKQLTQAAAAIQAVREQIPPEAYATVQDALVDVSREFKQRAEEARVYASLLGSLATAGMTSLAYEHEISAQRGNLEELARRLKLIAAQNGDPDGQLSNISEELSRWGARSERIRRLFRPLLEEESRTTVGRYGARDVVEDVVETVSVLARTAKVDFTNIPPDLILPAGTFTAWSAVVQNVLTNAFRATIDSRPALVKVDGERNSSRSSLRFQDNGYGGVDIKRSARLFQPFERGDQRSRRAEALGLGGSGLGLTIVKMITDEMNCKIAFEDPDEGWSTSLRISWENDD